MKSSDAGIPYAHLRAADYFFFVNDASMKVKDDCLWRLNHMTFHFVATARMLKSSRKACKINDFTARKGVYYIATTPFFGRVLM